MPGIIALDIDGTLTQGNDPIAPSIASFLEELAAKGWKIIFITGRTFSWSLQLLHSLPFPYHLAVQQGALLIEMPSKKILSKKYIDKSICATLDKIFVDEPTDFVLFTGFEYQDICYFRSHHFNRDLLEYVRHRAHILKETWIDTPTFENVGIPSFASIKSFGEYPSVKRICEKIEAQTGLHAPIVKDPFHTAYYVGQATHPEVNKGNVLETFRKNGRQSQLAIAVGDDWNDAPMFAKADLKVVMETAPKELLAMADVIAPSVSKLGVIEGITKAIAKAGKNL